ncbi:hypothetical protein Tsubulata_046225 [Turnera subulata]|uniref:Uncharacterized protein n=1 Tax=Turnera subulata TaxID=218843 RepID=A0A9Q0F1W3_9ROSI|nr:hypothetical protein Tsubulata_046225 [Turnera subulata]
MFVIVSNVSTVHSYPRHSVDQSSPPDFPFSESSYAMSRTANVSCIDLAVCLN